MNALRWAAALALAAWIGSSTPAVAQGPTGCVISLTGVQFGTYDVFSAAPLRSTGTIVYRCGNRVRDMTIALTRGQGGTYVPRTMQRAGEPLRYNLYLDAALGVVWGDGSAGTSLYSVRNARNNRDVAITIYGSIPAQQDVAAGTYTDDVTATINF
jgi:spore coat protein U-like protein